jgi:hypothetical protein
MGQVTFDETDKPLMRMTYQGLCDDAEWQRATQRRAIVDWINRDRQHLKTNCAGGALIFSSPIQQGLWTAIAWVTPTPIPVKIFRDIPSAEAWLRGLLEEKMAS